MAWERLLLSGQSPEQLQPLRARVSQAAPPAPLGTPVPAWIPACTPRAVPGASDPIAALQQRPKPFKSSSLPGLWC